MAPPLPFDFEVLIFIYQNEFIWERWEPRVIKGSRSYVLIDTVIKIHCIVVIRPTEIERNLIFAASRKMAHQTSTKCGAPICATSPNPFCMREAKPGRQDATKVMGQAVAEILRLKPMQRSD